MEKKKLKSRKELAEKIIPVFRKLFPDPISELNYGTDWEFAVAVILSAQCTDKRVNIVTKDLFKKYKTLSDYVDADIREFEQDIFSTGFYKNKAKNILSLAKILKEDYNGELPRSLNELVKLPGIGRKTANVLLGNLYGINEGIAVDTHVIRFARKFNLSDFADATKIERDLMEIFPREEWNNINHYMVLYGRYMCPASSVECYDELTALYKPAIYKLKK